MSKIVWTNGCFDLLHPGHIELFKVGKSLGDKLIVGLDSDERVSEMKGCLLYTSPSPRDRISSRMPSSA